MRRNVEFGHQLRICSRIGKNYGKRSLVGRSQDLPNTYYLLLSSQQFGIRLHETLHWYLYVQLLGLKHVQIYLFRVSSFISLVTCPLISSK